MATSPSDYDMSDSSSPGASYMKCSPYSSPSQQVPQLGADLTELFYTDNKKQSRTVGNRPYLNIIEQPQNYFRFRYDSELTGTHGCLLGRSCGPKATKTHPTVELVNHKGKALIACHLAQHDNCEEHPHKLIDDDQNRDVSKQVPEKGSYKVAFRGIGIIQTAKKPMIAFLRNKIEKNGICNGDAHAKLEHSEKSPELSRSTFALRKTAVKQHRVVFLHESKVARAHELDKLCEKMAKSINLNIVRLKFSAHDVNTGEEICEPVFSEPIYNMKSSATNNLKICRISRSSGSASGGEDVFMLVEKINKKHTEIRFFELDEDGKRSWTAIGQFAPSDVHHQYAIVFRTPPYRDPKTPVDVTVYIELVRTSDGHNSEPTEFKYKADPIYSQMKKRKLNSSCYFSSGSLKSNYQIPVAVANQQVQSLEYAYVPSPVPETSPIYLNTQPPTPLLDQCNVPSGLSNSDTNQPIISNPMWSYTNAVLPVSEPSMPPSQLNTVDIQLNEECTTETDTQSLSDDLKEFLSLYFKNYNEEFPGDKTLENVDFSKAFDMVPDSGRALNSRNIIPDAHACSFQETLQPQMDVRPITIFKTEYNAFYKVDDGVEVKRLVTELCEMIRNNKYLKKQQIRTHLERLFNIRLSNGDTFLHMMLFSNPVSLENIVKVIHNVRATHLLNCSNDRQQTTLHLAILNDMPKIVSLLVANGANPMLKDSRDLNAVHYAVKYESCLEPLLDAIKKYEVVCNLNDYNGEKQSALHMAVVSGCEHSTRLLLQHGASYNVRDEYGRTPLHLAAYDDRRAVTRTLLDFIPLSEIDVMDDSGNTALQIVCGGSIREHTIAIARLLLDNKADPLKKEDCNKSAWYLVRDKPKLKALMSDFVAAEFIDETDANSSPDDDFESADEGDSRDEITMTSLAVVLEDIK